MSIQIIVRLIFLIGPFFSPSLALKAADPKIRNDYGILSYIWKSGKVCKQPVAYFGVGRSFTAKVDAKTQLSGQDIKAIVKWDYTQKVMESGQGWEWLASRNFETCIANAGGSMTDALRNKIDEKNSDTDRMLHEDQSRNAQQLCEGGSGAKCHAYADTVSGLCRADKNQTCNARVAVIRRFGDALLRKDTACGPTNGKVDCDLAKQQVDEARRGYIDQDPPGIGVR